MRSDALSSGVSEDSYSELTQIKQINLKERKKEERKEARKEGSKEGRKEEKENLLSPCI